MPILKFAALLTILTGVILPTSSCSKKEISEITTKVPPEGELLVNTRLFEFDSSLLNPWIDKITHLRSFGVDFSKPKNKDGLYQYVGDKKMTDYIDF